MEALLSIDQLWFLVINRDLSNGFFDLVLPLLRNKYFWAPLYVFLIGYALTNYQRPDSYLMVICMIMIVLFSDIVSSHLLKKSIQRPRPCHTTVNDQVPIQRVYCGRGYSFPSSHATNHFSLATAVLLIFGIRRISLILVLISWASVVSYSQIYVGLHYPLDIIAGSLLGVGCAFFMYAVLRRIGILRSNL